MKNRILFSLLTLAIPYAVFAQNTAAPTWASDVQCIIYSHCTSCHNPNGIAPITLLTYDSAVANMTNIKRDVTIKKMPPYLPNTNYQHYTDMRVLTQQEINTLVDWVNAGGPEGDTSNLLPQPVYTTNVVLTHPDLTARIPNYTVPYTGNDLYRCFILTNPQAVTKFIKTIEVIPGNRNAVHHVLVFEDTASVVVGEDSADPGPGFTNFGGTGSYSSKLIGAWVPGAGADSLPPDMGIELPQGARIIIQVHYPVTAQGLLDSTRVNIQYTATNNVRNVGVDDPLNFYTDMTDGPLVIPADSIKTFHEEYTVPGVDITLLSVAPHAHLVCTQLKTFAVTPENDTIPLIEIDNWDFHWQGQHTFQRPIKIPAFSKLYGIATYNNTLSNPEVPLPLQTVYAGESTTNEMMLFFFWYLIYQPGDENIIIDTTSHQAHFMDCTSTWVSTGTGIGQIPAPVNITAWPNPAQNQLNYKSDIDIADITIIDLSGKVLKQSAITANEGQIPLPDIATGFYFIRFRNKDGSTQVLRFVKE